MRAAKTKRSGTRRLRYELLEDRRLLAGDVTATKIGVTLYLSGDASANAIHISAQDPLHPGNGSIYVTGAADTTTGTNTTVNHNLGPRPFSGIQNIVMDMKAGNDEVYLDGPLTLNNLTAKLGADNDFVSGNGAGPLIFKGDVKIDCGDGNDVFDGETPPSAPITVYGCVEILLGKGTDSLDLLNTTIYGKAKFDGGDDTDAISFEADTFKSCLDVCLGNGGDANTPQTLSFVNSSVCGAASFKGGNGVDNFDFFGPDVFKSSLNVCLGKGSDTLLFGGSDVAIISGDGSANSQIVVYGNASFDCCDCKSDTSCNDNSSKNGASGSIVNTTLDFDQLTLENSTFRSSLDVCLGKANASVYVSEVHVCGSANFGCCDSNSAKSDNNKTGNSGSPNKSGSASLSNSTTTTTSVVDIIISNSQFDGCLQICTGCGFDYVTIARTTVKGKTKVDTGDSNDVVSINDSVFAEIGVSLGNGDQDILFISNNRWTKAIFDGGPGANDIFDDFYNNNAPYTQKNFEHFNYV